MEPYQEFIREGREKIKANSEAERKVAMLNTAKAYFKQDGLARTIRKFYIDRINEAMKSYVSLFNFSFLPKIDDTAGIENYNMYSGGQKIAIAILMKLTLNMMLNNPINMLILDEPTPYMDSERIEAIRELVDNIKDKMQVFVITHDVEFMEISCNTINL
jgi:exonuclease SbcC